MFRQSKETLKRILQPLRTVAGRFIITDTEMKNSIFHKAGYFMASDKIKGDYLEFGVYEGATFISAFKAIRQAFMYACLPNNIDTDQDRHERQDLWGKMRFFAFDSFQGLPPTQGIDTASRDFHEGKFSTSQDAFLNNIVRKGVPAERVITVPGWFEETLNDHTTASYKLTSAAIVHIDSDLYESARLVLNFITPLLTDGTVIIFDDWYNFRGNPNLGEQRACREWTEANPSWALTQYQKEGPWRNSFIANRIL